MLCCQESSGAVPVSEHVARTLGPSPQVSPGAVDHRSSGLPRFTLQDIIGCSPALAHMRHMAWQAAHFGASVLLMGESGTGKTTLARAIHAASVRQGQPFVTMDCAAVPHGRLESEIFGGVPQTAGEVAREGHAGKLAQAQDGTLFLKEVGVLPLDVQAKLLRVLQERLCLKAGQGLMPVTCTVIAATEQNLEQLVSQGRFRRDLYYRLGVVQLELPPLRERPEDISLLAWHYWERKSREVGRTTQPSPGALRVLETYPWPGNVRELMEVIEQLVRQTMKPVIEVEDLPATVLASAERHTLQRALREMGGNRTKAAQSVGLSRRSFDRKLKAYGLLTWDGAPLQRESCAEITEIEGSRQQPHGKPYHAE